MQNEDPFSVRDAEIRSAEDKMLSVSCKLPLAFFAGEDAEASAKKLISRLNNAFHEVYPEIAESMQAADKLRVAITGRKWSDHMYLAIYAVLKTQRDNGLGPMDWQDICSHPDFRFPAVIGNVFGERPLKLHKVRKSIQNAVRHLQSKGVDVEAIIIPGRGLCYSLC